MKKLFVLCGLLVLLSGCNYSVEGARNSVINKYPSATIVNVPDKQYSYIVRLQTGELRLVRCMTNDNLITEDIILMTGLK